MIATATVNRVCKAREIHKCNGCGAGFSRNRGSRDAKKYCSRECAWNSLHRKGRSNKAQLRLVAQASRSAAAHAVSCGVMAMIRFADPDYVEMAVRKDTGRKSCVMCHKRVIHISCRRRYCTTCGPLSVRASLKAGKVRRKRTMRDAVVERVVPADVYRRDDYKCRLCGGAIRMDADPNDDLAPNLDHVIPLSKGGAHSMSNLQATHRICNLIKSDGPSMDESTTRHRNT